MQKLNPVMRAGAVNLLDANSRSCNLLEICISAGKFSKISQPSLLIEIS